MSDNVFAEKLPESYTAPPTKEQLAILQLRRKVAISTPLHSDLTLGFMSSDLHPASTALVGQSKSALCTSPNPLRPLNDRLQRALEEGGGASGSLQLRLVEELQGKEDKWSQVWFCYVELGEEIIGEVAVKLLAQSLFPYPEDTWWLPWCYGFYRFDMPWGEEVTGILLEDLSDPSQAQTVEACVQAGNPEKVEPDIESFDSLVLSIFLTQQRLQNLGIVSFWATTHDIILLSTQDSNGIPHTVFLDFGETETREEEEAQLRLPRPPCGWPPRPDPYKPHPLEWRHGDEHRLAVELSESIGGVVWDWMRSERAQDRVGLVLRQ